MDRTRTIAIGNIGGIQSLCTAKKGDSEICLIGHVFCETCEVGPLSCAEREVKATLSSALAAWSRADQPVTLITFDTRLNCQKALEMLQTDHAPTFHAPLRNAMNAFAAQNQFQHENLKVVSAPPLEDFENFQYDPSYIFGLETFPTLASKANFTFHDIRNTDVELAQATAYARRKFFQRNDCFEGFTKAVQELVTSRDVQKPFLTIEGYFKVLEYALQHAKTYLKTLPSQGIKKQIKGLILHLELAQQNSKSYFAAYGITSHQTVVDALLEVIKKRQTINESITEFIQELLRPLMFYRELATHATIYEHAQKNPRLVVVYSHNAMHELLTLLKDSGYSITHKGNVPKITQNSVIALHQSPFSSAEISSYLETRFALTPQKAEPLSAAFAAFQEPGESKETLGAFLSKIAHASSSPEKTSTDTPLEEFTALLDDLALSSCSICKKTLYLAAPLEENFCSQACLITKELTQRCPDLVALLRKKKGAQNMLVRNQLSALCYLWFIALSPQVRTVDNEWYKIDFKKLLSQLEALELDQKTGSTWPTVLVFAQALGIDPSLLKVFIKHYQAAKERYTRTLITHAKHRAKKGAPQERTPVFDDEEVILRSQQELYHNLRQFFTNTQRFGGIFFAQFYYALIERLTPEFFSKPILLHEMLCIEVPQRPSKGADPIEILAASFSNQPTKGTKKKEKAHNK